MESQAAAGTRGDTDAPRVLVVDDEQSITDLVCLALRYEGFEVAAAHAGRPALDAAPATADPPAEAAGMPPGPLPVSPAGR